MNMVFTKSLIFISEDPVPEVPGKFSLLGIRFSPSKNFVNLFLIYYHKWVTNLMGNQMRINNGIKNIVRFFFAQGAGTIGVFSPPSYVD